MVKHLVNLDALIMREDFDVEGDGEHSVVSQTNLSMNIFELEKERFTRESLRKPDFQRETVDWIPEKIAGLVESFVTGDVVPSIILWRSPKSANVFVIDGAHRLSALIAWVSDDFGDGEASRRFFQDIIPPEQQAAADDTRRRIEEGIGSYESLRTPDATSLEQQQHAKNLVDRNL